MTAQRYSQKRKRHIAQKVLTRAEKTLANTPGGRRDTALGEMIKNVGKYYHAGYLTEQQITEAVVRACCRNELDQDAREGGIAEVNADVPRCLANNKSLAANHRYHRCRTGILDFANVVAGHLLCGALQDVLTVGGARVLRGESVSSGATVYHLARPHRRTWLAELVRSDHGVLGRWQRCGQRSSQITRRYAGPAAQRRIR